MRITFDIQCSIHTERLKLESVGIERQLFFNSIFYLVHLYITNGVRIHHRHYGFLL